MTEKMTLDECERAAKDRNLNGSGVFDIICPAGRVKAKWLDAYFGFIILDDSEGFVRADDIRPLVYHCENLRAEVPA